MSLGCAAGVAARRLAAALVCCLALLAATAGAASAAPAGNGFGVTSFQVTPSSTASAGAHPNVNAVAQIQYPDSAAGVGGALHCAGIYHDSGTQSTFACDTLRSATIALPPGLLVDLAAVPELCTPAQLAANACPPASQIGSGYGLTYAYPAPLPGLTLPVPPTVALFLMPAQSTGELAEVGMVASVLGIPVLEQPGAVTVAPNGSPQVSFENIPQQVKLLGLANWIQIVELNLTINGYVHVPGGADVPFTIDNAPCDTPAVSTISVTSYHGEADRASSQFSPQGCVPQSGRSSASGGVSGSFSVVPTDTQVSTPQAGSNPDLVIDGTFGYGDATDSLDNLTLTFAPGLLANPTAVAARCTPAQLQSSQQVTVPGNSSNPAAGCPQGSLVGSGVVAANISPVPGGNGGINAQGFALSAYAYLMPTQNPVSPPRITEIARLGVIVALGPLPIATASAPVALTPTGRARVSFSAFPRTASLIGMVERAQVARMALRLNGTGPDGLPFTINPNGCATAVSDLDATTYEGGALSTSSSFAPGSGPGGPSDCPPPVRQNPCTQLACWSGFPGSQQAFALTFFQLIPSTDAEPANPNLQLVANLSYPDSTDALKDLSLTLPSGMGVDLGAAGICAPAQLAGDTCPAASRIGSGTAQLSSGGQLSPMTAAAARVYATGPQSAALVIDSGAGTVLTMPGAFARDGSGRVTLSFSGIPRRGVIAGQVTDVQLTSLVVNLAGSVNGRALISSSGSCAVASSTLSADSYEAGTPQSLSSSYTPTACGTSLVKAISVRHRARSSVYPAHRRVLRVRHGAVSVPVRCADRRGCSGSVGIYFGAGHASSIGATRFRRLRYGNRHVTVRLTGAGRRLLARHHRQLTVSIVARVGHATPNTVRTTLLG